MIIRSANNFDGVAAEIFMGGHSNFHRADKGFSWNKTESATTLQQKYSTNPSRSLSWERDIWTWWNTYALPLCPHTFLQLWQLLCDGQFLSPTGQWLPADPGVTMNAYTGPKPHSARAEGCVGREWTPGQRLVELTLIAQGLSPCQQSVVHHPFTLRKGF